MANPITDHDIIVQYNRENGTNFYNIKQVNEDKLKKAEAHKVWASDDETIGSSRFRATNAAVHNAPTQKQATKIALDAAKQRGIETAAMAAVAAAPYALPIIANPVTASTTAGAVAATGLDAMGLVGGLNQLNNYWNNRKNLTWKDTPGILLSGLSLLPGSSQLTNPRNLNIATNAVKSLNPAFKYRSLLERVKVNPELAPYYNDAASAKIKVTLKNDGTYNPDTHTVTLPLFGNKRTIAHEMGHAALRGGEMDIPNYDYTGTGLNKGNEAAADWFAGNLNERYYGKDAVMQARQNAVDNFDIIRKSLADGTLRFGEPTTYNGVHQSSKSMQQFEFPHQRWDVINHGADPNGAFFTLNGPANGGFLAKRPYASYWEIKSQKPLIQIGEIRGPGNTKNNVRNAIVDYARRNGADAVEFRGIADNNLQNQNILFATDKSGIRFKYESPVTEEISIVPQKEFTSLERLLSNEDLDRYNRLMKSFMDIPPESINEKVLKDLRKLESLSAAKIRTSDIGWGWRQIKLQEEFDKKLNNLIKFINKYRAKEIEKRVKNNFGWRPHSKSMQSIIDSDFTPFDEMKTLYQTGSKAKTTEDFRLSDYYKQGGTIKAQFGLTLPNPPDPNTDLVWNQSAYVPKNQRPLTLDEIRKNILWRFNYNNNRTVNNRNNNRPKNIGIFTNPAYGKRTKMVSDGGEVE